METPKKQIRPTKSVAFRYAILQAMKKGPDGVSGTVAKAVTDCYPYPKKLVEAFTARFDEPPAERPVKRVCLAYPVRIRRLVEDLALSTKLSQEETIRLCVEVYLKRKGLR